MPPRLPIRTASEDISSMVMYKEVLKRFQKALFPSSTKIESEPSSIMEGPKLACRRIVPSRGVDSATQTNHTSADTGPVKFMIARKRQRNNSCSSCDLEQLVSRNAWV